MINTIGILGGTGSLGTGISFRLAKCGYNIIIGSRNPQESKILILAQLWLYQVFMRY